MSGGRNYDLSGAAPAFLLTSSTPLFCSDYSSPGTASPWQPHSQGASVLLFLKRTRWKGSGIYMFWVHKGEREGTTDTGERTEGFFVFVFFSFFQFSSSLNWCGSKKKKKWLKITWNIGFSLPSVNFLMRCGLDQLICIALDTKLWPSGLLIFQRIFSLLFTSSLRTITQSQSTSLRGTS